MLTFGIRTILLLILLGGAIAFVGDYIGRSIGRKRLTIFNLRPRYTAIAITMLTGILIVFITTGIMLAISKDVRTALFGLDKLRTTLSAKTKQLEETKKELSTKSAEREKITQELTDANKQLASAKENLSKANKNLDKARLEIAGLESTKEKLGKEVEVSRKGKVLFKVGDVLLTSVIQAGPEKEKLETGLKQILSTADTYVRSFGVKSEKHLIYISPEEFAKAVSTLQDRRGENIVMVVATRNTVFGEEVPVRFEVSENKLIYKGGSVIAEAEIPPSSSVPEIEWEIKKLLNLTNLTAKKAGVLPDSNDSMGSVPYSQIFALGKKIKAYQKGVRLKTLAKTDIYTTGPLEIKFVIYYQ
jgi:uncharacterized protein (DUF3084 family)